MGDVIVLNTTANPTTAPRDLWKLRWRVLAESGVEVMSAWTPETRYPSQTITMDEFRGRIATVFVDGIHRYDNRRCTFLKMPGHCFDTMSYKMMGSFAGGRSFVGGIELADVTGVRYLVLRDGTVYIEGKEVGT